jgi:catechol 2,3-dioxygenase-like lactoylglutathione lyase family enzyme
VEVEHVDFISVPVSDMQRSTAWYRDTLGLPQTGERVPESKLGDNAFLYLIDPASLGGAFTTPQLHRRYAPRD